MTRVKDILCCIDAFAPCKTKMDFDNVGILCGKSDAECTKVLIALDITDEVIKEAVEEKADLIVSHHPMFFGLKSVTDQTAAGKQVITLIENGIAAICMHTNLDAAEGGVNDALAEAVKLVNVGLLKEEGRTDDGKAYGIGRVGELEKPMEFAVFLEHVKCSLKAKGLRYSSGNTSVHKIAVVGGSGGDYLDAAAEMGCDTLLTADVKYHVFINAKAMGMNIIDGGHFPTENVVVERIAEVIKAAVPFVEVCVSKVHKDTVEFV